MLLVFLILVFTIACKVMIMNGQCARSCKVVMMDRKCEEIMWNCDYWCKIVMIDGKCEDNNRKISYSNGYHNYSYTIHFRLKAHK